MTTIVLPISAGDSVQGEESTTSSQRMKVIVNIHAEVMETEVAKHHANSWLLENVGNFLSATTSELVLGERLFWRYDVILGLPNPAQPGSGAMYRIGQIVLDAVTGEIQNAAELAEELRAQTRELK